MLGRRAGEAVDGLVGVAHHAQVVAAAEPRVEQALLQRRHVLVLVDDEMAVAGADLGGDVAVFLQRARRDHQQVGEVEDARAPLGLVVLGVHLRHRLEVHRRLATRGPRGLAVGVRGREHGLGPLDLGGEVAHLGPVGAQPQPGGRVGHDPQRAVDQIGHGTAEHARREVLQLAPGCGVERPGLDAVRAERPQPGPQFTSGPRGEGDGEQLARRDRAGTHLVGDPVGDRARLARPGPGQDADRPAHGERRRALLGIEPGEDLFGPRTHLRHAPILPAPSDRSGPGGHKRRTASRWLVWPGPGYGREYRDGRDSCRFN